jgi:hypothetical protein
MNSQSIGKWQVEIRRRLLPALPAFLKKEDWITKRLQKNFKGPWKTEGRRIFKKNFKSSVTCPNLGPIFNLTTCRQNLISRDGPFNEGFHDTILDSRLDFSVWAEDYRDQNAEKHTYERRIQSLKSPNSAPFWECGTLVGLVYIKKNRYREVSIKCQLLVCQNVVYLKDEYVYGKIFTKLFNTSAMLNFPLIETVCWYHHDIGVGAFLMRNTLFIY